MTVVRFLARAGLFTRLTLGPTQHFSVRVSSSTGVLVLGETYHPPLILREERKVRRVCSCGTKS